MELSKKVYRCFIAVDFESEIKSSIFKIVKKRTKEKRFIRSIPKENYHITIKFLGNIDEAQINNIIGFISEVKTEEFEFILDSCGYFNRRNPKVLWLSFKDKVFKFNRFALEIINKLEEYGFKKEYKEFKPHITIARLKLRSNSERNKVEKVIENINLDIMKVKEFKATHIGLYKSELTGSGAVYTLLYKKELTDELY